MMKRYVKSVNIQVELEGNRLKAAKAVRDSLECGLTDALQIVTGVDSIIFDEYHQDNIYDVLNDIVEFAVSGEIVVKLSDEDELKLPILREKKELLLKSWREAGSFDWFPEEIVRDDNAVSEFLENVLSGVEKQLRRLEEQGS